MHNWIFVSFDQYFPVSLSPAPDKNHSILCFYEFDHFRFFMRVGPCNVIILDMAYFTSVCPPGSSMLLKWKHFFLFWGWKIFLCVCVCIPIYLTSLKSFIYRWTLSFFHVLAIVNNAAINTVVRISPKKFAFFLLNMQKWYFWII